MNMDHEVAAYVASHRPTRRKGISPATVEQRDKVRAAQCVNCGGLGCDPAHLVSRAQGGCDSPHCVVALCRNCHRAFDLGGVDLEPVIALPEFSVERAHMASHMSFQRCIQRLNGRYR
jgi:hypothetical protein